MSVIHLPYHYGICQFILESSSPYLGLIPPAWLAILQQVYFGQNIPEKNFGDMSHKLVYLIRKKKTMC